MLTNRSTRAGLYGKQSDGIRGFQSRRSHHFCLIALHCLHDCMEWVREQLGEVENGCFDAGG
jgi:hypothetical protein